jgi:hypothetical protein
MPCKQVFLLQKQAGIFEEQEQEQEQEQVLCKQGSYEDCCCCTDLLY